MTARRHFESTVARLEPYAERHPRAYRARVLGLVLLGYLYLLGMLAALLAVVVGFVALLLYGKAAALAATKSLLLPAAALAWVLARSLWVRLDAPAGAPITRAEAPALFGLLDDLRGRTGGPRIHEVLVDESFNCAVVQKPRLGLFGWPRNYLVVGLPFAMAVGPDTLESVLAHEYGHLAGAHGSFGSWVYRLRRMWSNVQARVDETPGAGTFLVRKFLDWYAPVFNAYTFVLARQNEYEADQASARAVGGAAAANALLLAELRGRDLEEAFWPGYTGRSTAIEAPPALPLAAMREHFARPVDAADARRYLGDAFERSTGHADTHPALKDRLAALGVSDRRVDVELPARSAAETLLGEALPLLVERFDRGWADAGGIERWKRAFDDHRDATARLAELDAAHAAGALDPASALEHAFLVQRLRPRDALALFEALHARDPDLPPAAIMTARLRLAADDARGLDLADNLYRHDAATLEHLFGPVLAYARRHRRDDVEAEWNAREEAYADALDAARAERRVVTSRDRIRAHALPAAKTRAIAEACARFPAIKAAWVCEKATAHFPQDPFVVVLVEKRWLKKLPAEALKAAVAAALDDERITFSVVVVDRTWKPLLRRARQYDNARVYAA